MSECAPWLCPVCAEPLGGGARTWQCGNGHSFDIAKEGYCNLLLASQMRSKKPGDGKEMLRARSAFLNAGHYRPLMAAIIDVLTPHMGAETTLLDCGCGDGAYAEAIHEALQPSIVGIDIAREGVRLAARRFKGVGPAAFAVASTFNLPLAANSCHAALQVFAPVSEVELLRVLVAEGVYCAVFPGPQHLLALKQVLYSEVRDHKVPPHPAGFTLLHERRVAFEMNLCCNADIQNLLTMTPLNWKGSREGKLRLRAMATFDVGADFVVRLYRAAARNTGQTQ